MPIDNSDRGAGYRRIAGLRAVLTAEQEAAVIKVDLRLLPWGEDLPAGEFDRRRAELEADAPANPRRSTLLATLRAGEPVAVELSMLHGRLPADAPPWLTEGRGYCRVYADDIVEPADGPADQRAY